MTARNHAYRLDIGTLPIPRSSARLTDRNLIFKNGLTDVLSLAFRGILARFAP